MLPGTIPPSVRCRQCAFAGFDSRIRRSRRFTRVAGRASVHDSNPARRALALRSAGFRIVDDNVITSRGKKRSRVVGCISRAAGVVPALRPALRLGPCAGSNVAPMSRLRLVGDSSRLPGTPISLGVPGAPNRGDECVIDFTFDVLKAPDTDGATDPLHPGLQTLPSGIVNGTASDFSTAQGFGTTFITVLQPVGIATTAVAGGAVGTALTDQATLTLGTAPTGSILFNLYAADDDTCTGTPIFASSIAVSGDGTYTSGPFTPTTVGDYRWRAFYSGDATNAPVAGALV